MALLHEFHAQRQSNSAAADNQHAHDAVNRKATGEQRGLRLAGPLLRSTVDEFRESPKLPEPARPKQKSAPARIARTGGRLGGAKRRW